MRNKDTGGFTLVELMVGISIVALLSSVAMYSTAQARAKAEDAKKKAEVGQVRVALALHKDTTGRVPYNYSCSGEYCSGGTGNATAVEGSPAYEASMGELVTRGYLSAVPKSKDGSYAYYADATAQRAAFGARLQTGTAQASGNSCPSVPSPLPFAACARTVNPPNPTPQYTGPNTVQYVGGTQIEALFCESYGSQSCYPYATGEYSSLCTQPSGPSGTCLGDFDGMTISCLENTSAASVCTGAGNDFCTCTE